MMMKMKGMCALHKTSWVLVLVGALNWGLVGLLNFNLVSWLLGAWPAVERIVYVLVGLAAIAMLGIGKCCWKACKCSDEACSHCAEEEKKPMGGEKPAMGGEHKM